MAPSRRADQKDEYGWHSHGGRPLLQMAVDLPVVLPRFDTMFVPPLSGPSYDQRAPTWAVAAWRISGNASHCKAFQRELSRRFLAHGRRHLLQLMRPLGRDGSRSVADEASRRKILNSLLTSISWSLKERAKVRSRICRLRRLR